MILGFTGTWLGPRPAQTASIRRFMAGLQPTTFVHGGARGADMIAHGIAESLWIPIIEVHPGHDRSPAVWEGMDRHIMVYPPMPPLERNRIIIKRVWGLLACPAKDIEELRSGTWATVRAARKIGCPVYVIWSGGRIERDRAASSLLNPVSE